jgi:hypothetical protein
MKNQTNPSWFRLVVVVGLASLAGTAAIAHCHYMSFQNNHTAPGTSCEVFYTPSEKHCEDQGEDYKGGLLDHLSTNVADRVFYNNGVKNPGNGLCEQTVHSIEIGRTPNWTNVDSFCKGCE